MNDIGESQVHSPPNASNINYQKYGGQYLKNDARGTNYSHSGVEQSSHNQVRSATTKKPRPQSGKPADKHNPSVIQTHVISSQ